MRCTGLFVVDLLWLRNRKPFYECQVHKDVAPPHFDPQTAKNSNFISRPIVLHSQWLVNLDTYMLGSSVASLHLEHASTATMVSTSMVSRLWLVSGLDDDI